LFRSQWLDFNRTSHAVLTVKIITVNSSAVTEIILELDDYDIIITGQIPSEAKDLVCRMTVADVIETEVL